MRLAHSVERWRGTVTSGGWATSGQVIDWTTPVKVTYPAFVQPDRETEQDVTEQSVETILRIVLPAYADVVETDRIRWRDDSDLYEVRTVEPWSRLGGQGSHLEVVVVKVEYAVG